MRWLATTTIALASIILAYSLLSVDAPASAQVGGAIDEPTATFTPTLTPTPTSESDDGVSGKGCDPGSACYEEIEIRQLSSSLIIGNSDRFKVRAFDLDRNRRYRIRVKRSNAINSDIGFNSRCSYSASTASVPARRSDYERTLTLYACATTGGTVVAELIATSGSTVYATASQRVSVVRATATPTPTTTHTPRSNVTATPTPTATHTPRPNAKATSTPRSNPTSTPTPDLDNGLVWTTYIRSAKDNNNDEYGYEEDDFGSIGDDNFQYGDREYTIESIKWDESASEVEFQLDDCLKPSCRTKRFQDH